MPARANIVGKRFGRFIVVEAKESIKNGKTKRTTWLCLCDCGNSKIIQTGSLTSGNTKSCGCLYKDTRIESGIRLSSKYKYARRKYSPQDATIIKIWRDRYSDGNISIEDFKKLSQENCYYCGVPPSNRMNCATPGKRKFRVSEFAINNGFYTYNGLDRIDQLKPHNIDNVVTCCKVCNYAKGNMTKDQFIVYIKKTYTYLLNNNKL